MPSPFPGMNPYLEQDDVWHDFHTGFPQVARAFLVPQVGPNYIVKIDEITFIHELPAEQRLLMGRPDIFVTSTSAPAASGTAIQALPGGRRIRLPAIDIVRHRYLEIRDRAKREVITVLELLSPSNKSAGPDRDLYLAKRQHVLQSKSHLVEIDLLRGGPRMPGIELGAEFAYGVLLSRAEMRPEAELLSLRLRDSLPDLPIPLRAPDRDVVLPLQQVLHRLYDEAGYGRFIYTSQPSPPLSPEDATWAQSFLPAS